jgi:hypothetical protein
VTREEIKRLADAFGVASWANGCAVGKGEKTIAMRTNDEKREARAALHAAIDAIPLGNLTDAALEGEPAPSMKMERVNEFEAGSSLQDELDISYAELVAVFGPPNSEGDPYKVDAYWRLKIDGVFCTIYNYKTGRKYLGKKGLDVEAIRDWHIGGKTPQAALLVHRYLRETRSGPADNAGSDEPEGNSQ